MRLPRPISGRLLAALPRVVGLPHEDIRSPIMELLATEVTRNEPGQQVVLDRLLDLALIATLRTWFARPEANTPGWYLAQSDPLIGTALRMIHHARPWTVSTLATAAVASRAAFARRFTRPMAHVPQQVHDVPAQRGVGAVAALLTRCGPATRWSRFR